MGKKREDKPGSPDPEAVPAARPGPDLPHTAAGRPPDTGIAPLCPTHGVACLPVAGSRGWYQCPQCDWRHRPLDRLLAAMLQRRQAQTREAR